MATKSPGYGVGLARAALGQGLGMGWGDEGEAWLRSKLGGGSYEDLVKKIREEQAAFGKEAPILSGAAEFVGGAAPGVAMMLVPGMQPLGANQIARSTAATIGRMGALGAATGTISGAGSAQEGDRLSGAGAGAVLGGTIGAAVPVATRAGGSGFSWLRDKLAPSADRATERAADKLNKALTEAEMKPRDIEKQLRRDRVLGAPSVVANADQTLADLAETVAQRAGKSARTVEKKLTQQKQGTRERTYQQVKSRIGGGDYYADEERLVNELRAKAKDMYDEAYAFGDVDDPRIVEALKNPQFQAFFNKARSIADTEAAAAKLRGEDPKKFALPEIYKPSGQFTDSGAEVLELVRLPDVRTLDYIKRGIDAVIDKGFDGNSLSKAEAAALRDLRREFVKAIDENVPQYAATRAKYAGDLEVIDAMRAGMNDFGKLDHEQVIKMISGMSDAEKEAFRTGVVRDLYGRIMNPSGNRNAAANIITSPEMQAKLQPLFDNPGQFRLFKAALEREAQLFGQANKILGGSQTGKRNQMREAFESDPGVGEVVAQSLTGGFYNSLTALAARVARSASMNDETASKLADMLMSRDPKEVAAVVKVLEDRAASLVPKALRAGKTEAGAVTGAASSMWPDPVAEEPERSLASDIAAEESVTPTQGIPAIEAAIQQEEEERARRQQGVR